MRLISKAVAMVAVLGIIACVAKWVDAAGVEGNVYEYRTIPTPDVQETYFGFGEFEPGGLFLVTIDEDLTPGDENDNSPPCVSEVYDGSWRQRRFRRRTYFKSRFDAFGLDFHVNGRMPTSGKLVGTSVFFDDGELKLVRWKSGETATCDLTAP